MNLSPTEIELGTQLYTALGEAIAAEKDASLNHGCGATPETTKALAECREALEDAKASVLAFQKRHLEQQFQRQPDGSIVVELYAPVRHNGESLSKVTVRPARVRDMKRAKASYTPLPEALASVLTTPEGIVDELTAERDFEACSLAVAEQLGKYRRAGWLSLP